ncbi:MAG: PAS domain S-box protein [Opitutus sp.]
MPNGPSDDTTAVSNAAGFPAPHPAGLDSSRWRPGMLEAFFEQAPFYAGVLSPDGVVTDAGRTALEACGYTREQVVGRNFWETPWWRGSKDVQAQLRSAITSCQSGRRFEAVLPYCTADTADHWVEFSLSPVLERGQLVFIIALGTDITMRVKAEAELAPVRKRLDSALLAAEIGTYEWDVVANQLHCDANLESLFGLNLNGSKVAPLETFVGAIHPDDRERTVRGVRRSVESGENFEEDYRVVLPNGKERWINSRGRMIKDEAGRVVNFFGMVMDITRRKIAEAEREAFARRLRRLTAIHETVLSATNDFAYVFDLEGRFLYANRPLLALYGRPLEDVVGKTFSQLGYPAWHAEMHLREIAQVISTRQPIQGEVPFRGESGISGIYNYIFTPVFGADGRVDAVAGTTRDVTEHKRIEAQDRLRVALDDALRPLNDPNEITAAAARLLVEYLGVNRCAYADVDADENTFNLTGDFNRGVPSIVGRYLFSQFGEECLRLMRAGESYVVTDSETDPRTEAVRSSYQATQIRSVVCVPLKKSGRFVAAMAVHQTTVRVWLPSDVEAVQVVASRSWESIERSRIVRVLAESEQRLRLALATGRLGVGEVSFPASTLTSSEQCRMIYGRAPTATFTYDDLKAAVHPDDRPRVEADFERSIARGCEFDLEHRAIWPDGSVHWILMRGQTTLGGDGAPQRMVGVSLDITARKEAEHEQVRLRENAVRSSRAKDEFLAALSHELRTPLNPVLLLASEAALDGALAPETRTAFETIRKNVELEARLIDDLLDLTAITRGKVSVRKEPRDLHAVLLAAVATVEPETEQKHISLDVKLGARNAVVLVDEVRLLQVVTNLLKNAAKFTPHGGSVVLATSNEVSGCLTVRVSDTGIGMRPEELSRIFEAFEQGDHGAKVGSHRFGGLGLGLTIARRLIELHDGKLEAASEGPTRGATFTLTLPLYVAVNSPAINGASAGKSPAASDGPRDGVRILLVEDHEPTRHAVEGLLRRRKYVVTTAGSVSEALQRASTAAFDLVISDVGLPDGDGSSLMAELRSRFGLRGIALTGYGMDDDIERSRAAGFVAHLTKPIRVEALDAALRDLLKDR